MDKGIFVALSGAVLQEKRMEVLADNLANVNTTGFKGQKPLFEDSMPDRFRIRNFGKLDEVNIDMSQGLPQRTERKLDVAIRGDGFFAVDTPVGRRYTRDGSFTISNDGTLTTRDGRTVLGENGLIKLTSADVVINGVGEVQVNGATVGKLKVVNFNDLRGLKREGSYFTAMPGVKEAPVSPNTQIDQGYIETSNVNAVKAMTTMIEAQRAFETSSKMIQSIDDLTRKSIDEVGRV